MNYPTKKECNECGDVMPLSMFHARVRNADGHSVKCKSCTNSRHVRKPLQLMWTPEKDALLAKYYPGGGPDLCAEMLGFKRRAVTDRASLLKIRFNSKRAPRGPYVKTTPKPLGAIPYQAPEWVAAHLTWQTEGKDVPVCVTGNLCATLRMAA